MSRPSLPIPHGELHWHFNALMKDASLALYGRRMHEMCPLKAPTDRKAGSS